MAHQMLPYILGGQEDRYCIVMKFWVYSPYTCKQMRWDEKFVNVCMVISLWGSLKILSAPCQQSSLGKAPHEKGWGWTLACLREKTSVIHDPECPSSSRQRWRAGRFDQRRFPPCGFLWRARSHQSSSTSGVSAGHGWSAWSGTGMSHDL